MATSLERHIDLIIKYPRLAKVEISWIYKHWHELKATQAEVSTLREAVAKHKRVANDLEKQLSVRQQELKSGRVAQQELEYAKDMNRRIRHLADIETKKASDAETARERESERVRILERRVEKLEKTLRETRGNRSTNQLSSLICKLAKNPGAGKRLAAACHPDKMPAELNDIATELFRFVQSRRVDSE